MILEQVAIACLVTLRPHEVQPFDQSLQRLEILQAVDVFRAYLAASCGHGSHYGNFELRAQLSPTSLSSLVSLAQISCRTLLGRERFSGTRRSSARGHKFLTCGIDAGDTDKLKTCRHGGQHMSCRTLLLPSPFCFCPPVRRGTPWNQPSG